MRRRSLFADIIFGGNQHGRWLNCRHCDGGAIQTLSLMSCVNCSLAHIYRPENDRRRTCVWTRWLTMIARYRFRMTDTGLARFRSEFGQISVVFAQAGAGSVVFSRFGHSLWSFLPFSIFSFHARLLQVSMPPSSPEQVGRHGA